MEESAQVNARAIDLAEYTARVIAYHAVADALPSVPWAARDPALDSLLTGLRPTPPTASPQLFPHQAGCAVVTPTEKPAPIKLVCIENRENMAWFIRHRPVDQFHR